MTNRFPKMNFGTLGCLITLAALTACGGAEESNSKAKCSGLTEGDFIITEFLANPAGTDDFKEYVEIYNPGDTPLTLDGVKLFHITASTKKETSNWTVKTATIEPKSYFTLGDFDSSTKDGVDPTPYAHLDYTFAKKLGLPSNGSIGLRCGSVVVDAVTYEGLSEARAQILSGDKLSEPANGTNWCAIPKDDTYEIPEIVSITYNDDGSIKSEKPNYGTPQKANPVCPYQEEEITVPEGKCIENGVERDIVSPEPGKLIFNEIMSKACMDTVDEEGMPLCKNSADPEYVELYSKSSFDLNGLVLSKNATSGNWTILSNSCLSVFPDQYVLVVRNADETANRGIPVIADVILPKMDLNQSGTLRLLLKSGEGDNATETVIDSVTYSTPEFSNVSWQRSDDKIGESAEDFASVFCASTLQYGDDMLGTPGYKNTTCGAVAGDGQCKEDDALREVKSPIVGDLRISEIASKACSNKVDESTGETKCTTDANYQYVELYALNGVDLNGVVLRKFTSNGEKFSDYPIASGDCVFLDQGSYAVLGKSFDASVNGGSHVTLVPKGFSLNQSGKIQLVIPYGGTDGTDVILDEVIYTAPTANIAWQLSADVLNASDVSFEDFCASTTSFQAPKGEERFGTPGATNVVCENTPPATNACAAIQAGQLVITEVLANPKDTDDYNEYVEIYNATSSAISLEGVTFTKSNATGGNSATFTFGSNAVVSASSYFVFADSSSEVVPSYADYAFKGKFSLPNTDANKLVLACGDTVIDMANYPSAKEAQAILLTTTNASDNDSASNSAWCHASTSNIIGGTANYGTPGQPNDSSACKNNS